MDIFFLSVSVFCVKMVLSGQGQASTQEQTLYPFVGSLFSFKSPATIMKGKFVERHMENKSKCPVRFTVYPSEHANLLTISVTILIFHM